MKSLIDFIVEKTKEPTGELKKACWKGYVAVGTKKKAGRTVPNCVPEHIEKVGDKYRLVSKSTGKNLGTYDTKAGAEKRERQVQYFKHNESVLNPHNPHQDYIEKSKALHSLSLNKDVDQKHVQQRKLDLDKEYSKLKKEEVIQEADKKDTVTVDIPLLIRLLEHAREDIKSDMDLHRVVEKLIDMRNKGVLTMSDYDAIVAIKEEVELDEGVTHINTIPHAKKVGSIDSNGEKFNIHHAPHPDYGSSEKGGLHYVSHAKTGEIHHAFLGTLHQTKQVIKQMGGLHNIPRPTKEEIELDEAKSPAWQRKAGKNPEGGLNKAGVASYRREHPGSKLQTAVTTKPSKLKPGSKAAKRRQSFCRRMKGMKAKLTSAKTAHDPDSRINKSLRKWNCK